MESIKIDNIVKQTCMLSLTLFVIVIHWSPHKPNSSLEVLGNVLHPHIILFLKDRDISHTTLIVNLNEQFQALIHSHP